MEQLNKVEVSSATVQEMADFIIGDSLNELDNYLATVRTAFVENVELLDGDLDKIILQLPVYIYNLIVLAENIEMKKGVAKEHSKYAQNEAMLNATGTVADKTAKAENQTAQDRITQLAYQTASSIVKSKIDAAMTVLDSAKKVQQRKIAEMKLTGQAGSAVGF